MSESVRVIVRCRPLNGREKNLKCKTAINVDEQKNQIVLNQLPGQSSSSQNSPKCFTFDGTYGPQSKTSIIYAEMAASLVESVLNGFNATVFAYGQTGCGKSFTMEGINPHKDIENNDFAGIIPRACSDLFDSVALESSGNTDSSEPGTTASKQFLVHASYLEIYNENVRDLLDQTAGENLKHLELKEHPDKGVYVRNLSMHRISTAAAAQKLMSRGWKNRVTGETLMNQDSSRSHAIFTIHVETECDGNIRAGKLHLVDLAGSERQSKTMATGIRLKEAAKINLSLSALGNVISSLVDGKAKHIPYRDSKLTRILQDSLGGNTKTLMIACISPADNNYEETLSTLRYANRAKKIKNAPRINEDPKDTLLRKYQEEILELKQLLQSQIGVDGLKSLLQKDPLGLNINNKSLEPTLAPDGDEEQESTLLEDDSTINDLRNQLTLAKKEASLEQAKRKKAETIVKKLQKKLNSKSAVKAKETLISEDEISESVQSQKSSRIKSPNVASLGNSFSEVSIQSAELSGAEKSVLNRVNAIKLENASVESSSYLDAPLAEVSPASPEHEKQLKRLLELQRNLTRSNLQPPLSQEALNSIKKKKTQIKSKQLAAEKRRELAKKAVEAQNDEEMFQALFENVHEDVRIQRLKLDKAKEMIREVQVEKNEIVEGFTIEKLELQENISAQDKRNNLLEAIIDKIQPLIKKDCNYANIDRIKKQAVFNSETQVWDLPKLYLERDRRKVQAAGGHGSGALAGQEFDDLPIVTSESNKSRTKTQLSARQIRLLGEKSAGAGGYGSRSPHQQTYSEQQDYHTQDYQNHMMTMNEMNEMTMNDYNDEENESRSMSPTSFSEAFKSLNRKPPGKLQPLGRGRPPHTRDF